MGFNSGFKGLNRFLDGPQSRLGCVGEQKIILSLPEFEHWAVQPVAYVGLIGTKYTPGSGGMSNITLV